MYSDVFCLYAPKIPSLALMAVKGRGVELTNFKENSAELSLALSNIFCFSVCLWFGLNFQFIILATSLLKMLSHAKSWTTTKKAHLLLSLCFSVNSAKKFVMSLIKQAQLLLQILRNFSNN